MTAPVWLAATSGSAGVAGQVNQFLASHAATFVYQGALQASNTTSTGGFVDSNAGWNAQQFTTGASQTAVGWVSVPVTSTTASGASLAPVTLSLYPDSGSGSPGASALTSVTVCTEYAYTASGGGTADISVFYPLPAAGLTPSTAYWLVLSPGGTTSVHYRWWETTATSGASTSPDGVTWTAQAYGLGYGVYDASPVPPLAGTWEDSGARWTALSYTSGQLTGISEYTAGQAADGYTVSTRTLSYAGNLLTGVA